MVAAIHDIRTIHGMTQQEALLRLQFHFIGAAQIWYETLEEKWKTSLEVVKTAFLARFRPTSNVNVELLDVKQQDNE